jgi:hypothetical protein
MGVILYEMLCGQVPINGENYNQLMYRVMTGEMQPPRALRPDIPVELEQLILRMMAIEPSARPASAAELEQALLAFCRPTFREHTIERTSAQGFSPRLTPQPHTGQVQKYATDQTVLAPTPPPMQRKRRGLVIAVVAFVAVAGAVAVVVAISSGGSSTPTATAPPPAPTPPAPAPPPPKPEPVAAPPQPVTVTLRFAVIPAGAAIEIDGKPADNPFTVAKDAAVHKLHITAPGYVAHDEELKFDETQKLEITLERVAKPGRPQPPRPNNQSTKKPDKKPDKIESQSPYDQ